MKSIILATLALLLPCVIGSTTSQGKVIWNTERIRPQNVPATHLLAVKAGDVDPRAVEAHQLETVQRKRSKRVLVPLPPIRLMHHGDPSTIFDPNADNRTPAEKFHAQAEEFQKEADEYQKDAEAWQQKADEYENQAKEYEKQQNSFQDGTTDDSLKLNDLETRHLLNIRNSDPADVGQNGSKTSTEGHLAPEKTVQKCIKACIELTKKQCLTLQKTKFAKECLTFSIRRNCNKDCTVNWVSTDSTRNPLGQDNV